MYKALLIIFTTTILLASCAKEAGEGGTSTIVGKLKVRDYDGSLTVFKEEYYAADEDVFIVYGEDSVYSDNFKTGYDGNYQFKYLRKGTYTLYALSKDLNHKTSNNLIPVKVSVTIDKNGETVIADDIVIVK